MVHLSELVKHISVDNFLNADDPLITGIALNSRHVREGYLFVALRGTNVDGHNYIEDAIQRGAAAVVGTKLIGELPVSYFRVDDARSALAEISAAFYDFPARKLTMIGVTGTDGKTTTANFIFSILKAAGIKAGMITTVNAVIGDQILDTGFHVTTPEAPEVQRYLTQMVEAGLTHVVLETTSHGLEQQRVGACDFDFGVVTNITHEHLDYHGSYEAYLAAKGRLLTSLADTTQKSHGNFHTAVINGDDQSYPFLMDLIPESVKTIVYGLSNEWELWARDIEHSPRGISFTAVGSDLELQIESGMLGEYNIYNILAALGVTIIGLGVDRDHAQRGIASLKSISGRMEAINLGQEFMTVVDFAHTP
ncbi:MAG: UDP-N-acetylmuramoyl-L-alanyl-D-glutamate--2,6-diaminopimelate ligase, partial [Chloroflexi bacterium]|nr:UDP-N-acetylmuramoyl-L-alanyl-D-glutamate--2,6-diaminopimelate ligase [Chloroflexota bacterium]